MLAQNQTDMPPSAKPQLDALYQAAMAALRTGVYQANPAEGCLVPNQSTSQDIYEAAMRRLQGDRYRDEEASLKTPEEKSEKVNVPFVESCRRPRLT